ncbi:MAG: mechanosensitive ion channel [Candidatus Caenarcaniphilales bacterium]|nr:mechanosensitive ion channel [Candidatus Caenarcaniphilales bacterium]
MSLTTFEGYLEYLPTTLGAIGILVFGWLFAWLVSSIVISLFKKTDIDNKIAKFILGGTKEAESINIEKWIGSFVFYLLMLFVLIAFFQVLGLTAITVPLNQLVNQIMGYAPRLIAVAVLLLLAWLIATALKLIVYKVLTVAKFDERVLPKEELEKDGRLPISKTLSETLYWIIFLIFLPMVLDALELNGLLTPVQSMLNEAFGYLPNIAATAFILFGGYLITRIVQKIISGLLSSVGADKLSEEVGLAPSLGKQTLSSLVATIVAFLIYIPVAIAALNALGLEAITGPASNMLSSVLEALPVIFVAALILIVAFILGKLVSKIITNILSNLGFNKVLGKLGLVEKEDARDDKQTPSELIGNLVFIGIILFASIEASNMLGFNLFAVMINDFVLLAGKIILGLVIFAIGLFLANLAAQTIQASSKENTGLLSSAARISIIVLAGAMALNHMGLANEIINLAFGVLLGSIAVAIAIAFGLGGKEIAARELDSWIKSMKSKSDEE